MAEGAETLEELLDQIDEAREDEERVSLEMIMDTVGRRSLGPPLLVAGLIVTAPVIGDIPGVPTTTGIFVGLIAAQIVWGRSELWLPKWMLRRSVTSSKLDKPLRWLRKPAKWVDRVLRPRLSTLTEGVASRVIAFACLLIAAIMPAMEIVPFSANLAGIILIAFGLALIAGDGLLALIGMVVAAGTLAFVISSVL
ncbi:MAG: exopolysaccharide biosynthesis protein [Gemmatimonadales bacterium]